MHKQNTGKGFKARLDHMFTDREFFMRSHGQVRFLTISATLQKRVFYSVAAALAFWLVITLAMMIKSFAGGNKAKMRLSGTLATPRADILH